MLSLLLASYLQEPPNFVNQSPILASAETEVQYRVKPLPGDLNDVPVFNSNNPELVQEEGILLSTFPPDNKSSPKAHLDYALEGRFDIFAHHVAKPLNNKELTNPYLGIILHNPTNQTVTVDVLSGASYLSQPDAPFVDVPPKEPPDGKVYAGPGSRVMDDILRGKREDTFPSQLEIPAKSSRLLLNEPFLIRALDPPLNGRSTYVRLESDGPVYAASLIQLAQSRDNGGKRPPTLSEWKKLLQQGDFLIPKDHPSPTPPKEIKETDNIIYGRVAGVSQGSEWETTVDMKVPKSDQAISYGISTLVGGTFGTEQVQSAPLIVRQPDTAYAAHGNYGVEYDLTFNINNDTARSRHVTVMFETPVKQDELDNGLKFLEAPSSKLFFRGTVKVTYKDNDGTQKTRYFHLAQKQGQKGEPLLDVEIPANQTHQVKVNFLYPPDSTPPQVISFY